MAEQKIKYEVHPREYTVIGISAAMQEFFTKDFIAFYGGTLHEMISVIKNGQYYHCELDGDRKRIDLLFLKRVNKNLIDLTKEYKIFDDLMVNYEKILKLPQNRYSLNTLKQFYHYYRSLLKYAYLGFDTIDYIDSLTVTKKEKYRSWVIKLRNRAENIYKGGENDFILKYLIWLKNNYFPGYSEEQLSYLFHQEIKDFIDKNKKIPTIEDLTSRQNLFYIKQYPIDSFQLLTGKVAEKEIAKRRLFTTEKYDNKKEFSGQVAYRGQVRGRVKIVNSRKDMPNFKNGEIIVSVMTEPGYLPIMKKAGAFITDEGGLLCHAAIVARELKKPCIIGTKIATKVLKDGQLVEVDAEKGIIKKI